MANSSSSLTTSTATKRAALRLQQVADRLRAARSSVAVAVAALQAQSADVDADVARLLTRSVADPLQDQIDSIKSVVRLLTTGEGRRVRRRTGSKRGR